jgi:hypothetical protein
MVGRRSWAERGRRLAQRRFTSPAWHGVARAPTRSRSGAREARADTISQWQSQTLTLRPKSPGSYRLFYRTGRNRSVSSDTLQHDESRKTKPDGTRRTQHHQPTALPREFKSPAPTNRAPSEGRSQTLRTRLTQPKHLSHFWKVMTQIVRQHHQ